MGISDHIDLDDLGHETQHLFEGSGADLEEVAVDTMGCGPLSIIVPPEHVEDMTREQHALFIRARMLNGKEVELMFNIGQVALLNEQTMEVQHAHIEQAFKLLDAPDDIRDGYYQAREQMKSISTIAASISTMAEMVMRLREVQDEDGNINESVISDLSTDEAKNLLKMVTGMLGDEGHLPGCPKGHHTHDEDDES